MNPREQRYAQERIEIDRKRRLRYYFITQDFFFPFSTWPVWAQEECLKRHVKNHERWSLFTFFTLNGLHPTIAAQFIMARDYYVTRNQLVFGEYDDKAIYQLYTQLPQQLREGTLGRKTMRVFDMIKGRPMPYEESTIE
jgi:hypothetical protein